MELKISKTNVLADVAMSVSIVARSLTDNSGASLYDKVRIQERDEDLVKTYVDAAYGSVLKELNNFIGSHTEDTITLVSDRRFNEAAISDLGSVVHQYMVSYAAAEWMKIKAVEFAPVFTGRADEHLKSIFEKLRFKTEPEMKKFEKTIE